MLIITQPVGLGYLEIDNRNSGGKHLEADTYTCSHCNAVVVLNRDRTRERYRCAGCSHHICDGCAAEKVRTGVCLTMAQRYQDWLESLFLPPATSA